MKDQQHRPGANRRPSARGATLLFLTVAAAALALAAVGSSAPTAACTFCGKNLIKNPGAESGRGVTAPNETGNVPHWTNSAGGFGAASYSMGIGWIRTASAGPKNKGKNYFFGGTSTAATDAPASVGTQTIKAPAGAAHHKATLSGWIGNYGSNTAQVRAEFMSAAGKVLSSLRIGPSVSIPSGDLALRTRSSVVPAGTSTIQIVITFMDHHNYNLAGADDLSLVLG